MSKPAEQKHQSNAKNADLSLVSENSKTPLLDMGNIRSDLRNYSTAQLKQIADELRLETIDAVSQTGGHLGAGLGVVELTVAIHSVFDTPYDRLIWDVGHQCYPHKILTGRRDRIRTIRQGGGLSGFTKRSESEYDPFGAAHSSTSISAGLGMAVAADQKGEDRSGTIAGNAGRAENAPRQSLRPARRCTVTDRSGFTPRTACTARIP